MSRPSSGRVRRPRAYLQGRPHPLAQGLSPAMWARLRDARDHGDAGYSLHGRSAAGGASGTLATLRRHGLLCGHELTDAGRAILNVEWRTA